MPTSPEAPLVAIGVDGARAGLVGACLYADALRREEATVWETRLELFRDVGGLAAFRDAAGTEPVVAIDVPIGLPDAGGFRPCDEEARRLLGARRSTVFAPPARFLLEAAGDHAAMRRLVAERRRAGATVAGVSAQAAGIAPRIAEVDAFVRAHPESERWLWECHPELSFLALHGGAPIPATKHAVAGVTARLRCVRTLFPDAEDRLAAAPWPERDVAPSDALDAYAALSTALALARGERRVLGIGDRDSLGVPMRMAFQPDATAAPPAAPTERLGEAERLFCRAAELAGRRLSERARRERPTTIGERAHLQKAFSAALEELAAEAWPRPTVLPHRSHGLEHEWPRLGRFDISLSWGDVAVFGERSAVRTTSRSAPAGGTPPSRRSVCSTAWAPACCSSRRSRSRCGMPAASASSCSPAASGTWPTSAPATPRASANGRETASSPGTCSVACARSRSGARSRSTSGGTPWRIGIARVEPVDDERMDWVPFLG